MSQTNFAAIVINKDESQRIDSPIEFKQLLFKSDNLLTATASLEAKYQVISIYDIDACSSINISEYMKSDFALVNLAKNILIQSFTISDLQRIMISQLLYREAKKLCSHDL